MRILLDVIDPRGQREGREEAIKDLAESLKEKGQFHPVIVHPVNNTGRFKIAAGDLRFFAAHLLGWTEIEAEVRELDDDASEEISIHENLRRGNLDWYEEAELISRFHELQQKRLGGKKTVGAPTKDQRGQWTIRDTARELDMAIGRISQDIRLVASVAANPALRNVKDKKTAVRLARISAQQLVEEEESTPFAPRGLKVNDVYLGDAVDVLRTMPDLSFDACVTDPPWLKFRDRKELMADEQTPLVFKEIFRLLKFNTLLYMFAGVEDYVFYRDFLETLGFEVSKTPLFWIKTNSMTRVGVKAWEYGRNFEFIVLAAKGSPVLKTSTQQPATFTYPVVPTKHLVHPNEKPMSLIQNILEHCTYENNVVLDPFAGSGATLEACELSKRMWVGVERDKTFYEAIRKRMKLDK